MSNIGDLDPRLTEKCTDKDVFIVIYEKNGKNLKEENN